MAYRNKTYVCFDGDEDIHYYRLMQAWKSNKGIEFNFADAHDLNTARDSSQEESIKRQLRSRFANSKLLVVLVGEKTKNLRKFVQWEMEVAIKLGLPIIAANLDGSLNQTSRTPATIRDRLVLHVPFSQKALHHAMSIWPTKHLELERKQIEAPYVFSQKFIDEL